VPAALRLTNDERAVEQLEPLARLEHAQVDQTLVLDAVQRRVRGAGAIVDETPLHRIDPEPEPEPLSTSSLTASRRSGRVAAASCASVKNVPMR
jgi:hypothetical protein